MSSFTRGHHASQPRRIRAANVVIVTALLATVALLASANNAVAGMSRDNAVAFAATSAPPADPTPVAPAGDTVITWVMTNTPAGSSAVTYPELYSGLDKAPKCGHRVQFATYRYTEFDDRDAVDNLEMAGTLNKGDDDNVIVTRQYGNQAACVVKKPTPKPKPQLKAHAHMHCRAGFVVNMNSDFPSGSIMRVRIGGKVWHAETLHFNGIYHISDPAPQVHKKTPWRVIIWSSGYKHGKKVINHGTYGPCK